MATWAYPSGRITRRSRTMRVLPGDVALLLAGERATPEQLATIRAQLGLDQPIWVQYGQFVRHEHPDFDGLLVREMGTEPLEHRIRHALAAGVGEAELAQRMVGFGEPVRDSPRLDRFHLRIAQ